MSMKVIMYSEGYEVVCGGTGTTLARFTSHHAAAAHHALALEKLEKESEWMPIAQIMPIEGRSVQVYDPSKGVIPAFYTINHKGEAVWETFDSLACDPTHWKPLSKAPG